MSIFDMLLCYFFKFIVFKTKEHSELDLEQLKLTDLHHVRFDIMLQIVIDDSFYSGFIFHIFYNSTRVLLVPLRCSQQICFNCFMV